MIGLSWRGQVRRFLAVRADRPVVEIRDDSLAVLHLEGRLDVFARHQISEMAVQHRESLVSSSSPIEWSVGQIALILPFTSSAAADSGRVSISASPNPNTLRTIPPVAQLVVAASPEGNLRAGAFESLDPDFLRLSWSRGTAAHLGLWRTATRCDPNATTIWFRFTGALS